MRQNHRNRLQGSLLQREALARVVLRMLHLQQQSGGQTVRQQRGQDLLRRLLR